MGALISEGAGTMSYGTLWQLAFPLFFFCITLFAFFLRRRRLARRPGPEGSLR